MKWDGRTRALVGLAAVLAALAPTGAWAHVKWFEDPRAHPLRTDLIFSSRTALTLAASAGALLALYLVQRLIGDPHWPRLGFLNKMAVGAPTLLAVQAAIALVYAAVQPALFAPNLPLPRNAAGWTLAGVEILIAFSFITGILDVVGALALIALGPVAFLLFPPMDVLDQFFWAGIGIVVLIVGRTAIEAGQARLWFRRRNPAWGARAVALLRVITGVSIIAPALSEKIWNPDLSAAFLAHHPGFNVLQTYLGVSWFTDDRFVLAAGIVEAVIGVLLISGVLTRLVILGTWVPFNLTVPFLPPQELLGHLPIFGIIYLLLVHGAEIAPGESLNRPAPRRRSRAPSAELA
jgi:uncharacterized membrane protein YphA (DoxX/SURF4 family)